MNNQKVLKGHIAAFFTILIWGTTFISTKLLLIELTPIEILFFRFILGIVALFLVYPHRLIVKDKKHELLFASAGLCGITLYYLLENVALTLTLASYVGVIVSVAPFFTGILAHFFLDGEKLKVNFILGFMIAIVGICFLSFNGNTSYQANPVGIVLALSASFVWAIYSILSKKISSLGYHTIQTTRRTFFYGLLFMLPAVVIYGVRLKFQVFGNPMYLFNMLFLGLGASALCFVTWNVAVKKLGAVKTSIYIYMVPVITIVTSILVLHEKITVSATVGTVLTLVGLFISESKFGLVKI